MKMRIYKKRRARYVQECNLMAKRLPEGKSSEGWRTALTLYMDTTDWYWQRKGSDIGSRSRQD